MRTGIVVAVGAVLWMSSWVAQADTLRCGDRLVSTGDTTSRVLQLCGEPTYRDATRVEKTKVEQSTAQGTTTETVEVRVERWSYNQGQGRLLKVLEFRDGVLSSISDGDRM